jgi:hypothetical protein
MRSKESIKKASQRARRKLLESSDEANIRKRLDAQRQAERRNNETTCLSDIKKQVYAQRQA